MELNFPLIYLLPVRLSPEETQELDEQIPNLTYDIFEAEVILGKIIKKERALFELRRLNLITEEIDGPDPSAPPSAKRQKLSGHASAAHEDGSSVSGDDEGPSSPSAVATPAKGAGMGNEEILSRPTVKVAKLAWFTDSMQKQTLLPLRDYLVYEGRKVVAAPSEPDKKPQPPKPDDILGRALADGGLASHGGQARKFGPSSSRRSWETHSVPAKRPALVKETTSEHDLVKTLPPIPDFLHTTYSCQRPTRVHPPNEPFIDQLLKIRMTRTLIGDKIGIRAYSTSIAAVAAYPYTITTAQELARLPGCGAKIAELWQEFKDTGKVNEAELAVTDPRLSVLKLFWEIWGVADATAREFYNKGWRDLDDIVEYGWNTLSRVQQIGVKYYDDFQIKIPRDEVKAIADTVLHHANGLRPGYQMVIVGGYRRGKAQSGDVDMIVSHPDEAATHNLILRLVAALEKSGHITHTLTLSTRNSERGQRPVAWKGNEKRPAGAGFDTLDKALVVWQDPDWTAARKGGATSNPNTHRRVDIIISPWRTVGCAVLGWTSGTTFQRDLRRYCKAVKGLKFDSSGVRSRSDGSWIDLEGGKRGPAPDMLTAEKRVFEGLELEWRSPEERCTG